MSAEVRSTGGVNRMLKEIDSIVDTWICFFEAECPVRHQS